MVRTLPLIGLIIFVAVSFGWRAWFHQRHFGHTGVVLFQSGRWQQHLRDSALLLLSGVLAVQAVALALDAGALSGLAAGPVPPSRGWLTFGGGLIIAGLALIVTAQLEMGVSWRVGVDEAARPGLVTQGLYRFSRNPIYAAMFVSLAGFACWLPTWPTFVVLALGAIAVRRQVRDEERYLRRAYGDVYATYASRVGRFVPGVGTFDA